MRTRQPNGPEEVEELRRQGGCVTQEKVEEYEKDGRTKRRVVILVRSLIQYDPRRSDGTTSSSAAQPSPPPTYGNPPGPSPFQFSPSLSSLSSDFTSPL
jgi:hypothetical protein